MSFISSMISKKSLLTIISGFVCLNTVFSQTDAAATNTLPATALKPYGRYVVDNEKNLELISSGVHFGFSFEGNEVRISTSIPDEKGHNYLQYVLDGEYKSRIKVSGNLADPITITLEKGGRHKMWIYKATEAHTGAIVIKKITARNIKSLPNPVAPLIEFIGNSITCGAAADASEVPCDSGEYHDHHNAYLAYGPRVAKALATNFILSSVSGIGVYRNWNSDGPTMPQVYEKADFQKDQTQLWDFKKYAPKVVSIALGTNDFSNGDGIKKRLPFDSAEFVNTYVKFVELVKSKYPAAQIALLSSPMINGDSRIKLQNCLAAVREKIDVSHKKGKRVAIFFFEPMQAHGCSGHPDINDHALMARQLVPFFKKLLD